MQRLLWLDGLRGIASAFVAVSHASLLEPQSIFGFLSRSYWDTPAEDNRSFLQTPPLRLLFAPGSMVTLFLVISGYAISVPLLQAREACDFGNHANLLRRLCSAATRRIFRIYLPVIVLTTISQTLYFLNLYHLHPPNEEWTWGLKPLSRPLSHFLFLISRILHLLDITYSRLNFLANRSDLHNFTMQLWTMPVEFRGSCVVYLLIMTLSFWRPRLRRMALLGVATYCFYVGEWDIFAFIAGLFLAEGHAMFHSETEGEVELSSNSPATQQSILQILKCNHPWQRRILDSVIFRTIGTTVSFLIGIYLLCLCQDQSFSTEYQFLATFQSPAWDDPEMGPNCWRSLGAVLTIYSISQASYLRSTLESSLVQYLGKISFALYLVHLTVYFIFKGLIRDLLWNLITRTEFPGTVDASRNTVSFSVAWIGSVLICGIIMISAADLWTRIVDRKCLGLARQFEKWATK